MVRGPAALLGTYALALTYFLAAPSLPGLGSGDASTLVAGGVGLGVLAACTLALAPARGQTVSLVILALAGALMAGALHAADVGPGANPFAALAAASVGLIFAEILDAPAAVLAVALLVAGIDILSVLGGPSAVLIREQPGALDLLTFQVPYWGTSASGQLGLSDIIFLSMFSAWAWRFDLRPRRTCLALGVALIGALALSVALRAAVPVLPLLACALLAPNADRLVRLFGDPEPG